MAQNLLKRREDEAALRDAIALARPGEALGPAGRVYAAFRMLARPGDPLRPARLSAVAADLQAPLDSGKAAEIAAALRETGGRGRPAPIAAAAAAEAVIALKPDAEPLALLCADAALAESLGWPTPLPLLASELFLRRATGEGRRPRPGEATWGTLVALRGRPSVRAESTEAAVARCAKMALKRWTRSCNVWRSIPPIPADDSRSIPSRIVASDESRLWLTSFERRERPKRPGRESVPRPERERPSGPQSDRSRRGAIRWRRAVGGRNDRRATKGGGSTPSL